MIGGDRGDDLSRGHDDLSGVNQWQPTSSVEPAFAVEDTSASDVFGIIANETRIEILYTLWEQDEPISFSALRDELDIDKGNFNYHLSMLEGHFVDRTPDGYELRAAGTHVIRTLLAGTFTSDPVVELTEIGLPCPLCGAPIELGYENECLTVRCTECPGVIGGDVPQGAFMHHQFPPAGLSDRAGTEVLEAARVHYETALLSMLQGVCPACGGTATREVHVCDRYETTSAGRCGKCASVPGHWVEHVCGNCSFRRWCTVWLPVLFHPAVISFVYERRPFDSLLDLRRLLWLTPECLGGITQEVVAEEPLRIRVTVPFEGETVSVTVDEDLNTVAVE